jgi:hypothetical protein
MFQPQKWLSYKTESDKGVITRIYRELKILNSKKIRGPIKKWTNELDFFKRSPKA